MATYLNYIDYFRNLAVSLLGHSPTTKTFYKKGIEEFLNGLTLPESEYPALLLNRSDFEIKDNGADSVTKVRTVAFVVFDHVGNTEDYDAIDTAFNDSEIITDKIYNQIRKDRLNPDCAAFLRMADMNSWTATEVKNSGDGNYGWFVTIDIESTFNTQIL